MESNNNNNGFGKIINKNTFIGEVVDQEGLSELNNIPHRMAGISGEFIHLKNRLLQVSNSNVPVIITGETGTGKELAAEYIHYHSNNSNGNFVVVDCTSLTETLFESELFGHEKGAFTNAVTTKKGLFEIANNGTLFLDEIGDLPLSQQPKLLRALERGHFRRVGGTQILTSKVRIVSATHKNLGGMVQNGTFRQDLFYRLSVLQIEINPLRDRKQDIPLLADLFLKQSGPTHFLTPDALTKLLQHDWPGNIRELKNCLQLAVALSSNEEIDKQAIQIIRRNSRTVNGGTPNVKVSFNNKQPIGSVQSEKEIISDLLLKFNGCRKHIANELGITERTLYRKLDFYNLN